MRRLLPLISLAFFLPWLCLKQVQAVPAAPNESLVHAEVIEVTATDSLTLGISPQRTLFRVQLRLIKVEPVEGMRNFLQGAEHKTIEVYATDIVLPLKLIGKAIQSRISFRGDERSGRYWIVGAVEMAPY
jgi:hypothetical protein